VIRENIIRIKQQIVSACARANRDAEDITLIAITKGRSIQEIKAALDNGLTNIGENRVQEAILKYGALTAGAAQPAPIQWHLVGHLQTNKAKDAVRIFNLIHSVDSRRLAEEIDRQAQKINKVQDILIEVNVSGEASKFGIKPEGAADLIKCLSGLKNINIKGLMTIAPIADNPQDARPYFRQLRELRDKINKLGIWDLKFGILSMGMTDDFEVAIEEGANMIRLGRAIFGS
jgi:PLP dependent protein